MKNNLKLYRTKSGYTQEDISKKIGVSRQTINSIENNRFHPSILLCLKLSKKLDCRLDDLFFLESWCKKSLIGKNNHPTELTHHSVLYKEKYDEIYELKK